MHLELVLDHPGIAVVDPHMVVLINMVVFAPILSLFFWMMVINGYLMIFNLIPIPPLDGSHILANLAPPEVAKMMDRVGPFGIIILFMLIQTDTFRAILLVPQIFFFKLAGLM